MTTLAAEHTDGRGVPSTVGGHRPTAVQDQPTRCALVREAVISPDGLYRYTLSRRWGSGPRALFVGLNPSRADGDVDDHSTRRMIRFAQAAGCGGLTLVNLFAWRSPSPRTLRQVPDPVGPSNDHWICSAVAAADLVVARGAPTPILTGLLLSRICYGTRPCGAWAEPSMATPAIRSTCRPAPGLRSTPMRSHLTTGRNGSASPIPRRLISSNVPAWPAEAMRLA